MQAPRCWYPGSAFRNGGPGALAAEMESFIRDGWGPLVEAGITGDNCAETLLDDDCGLSWMRGIRGAPKRICCRILKNAGPGTIRQKSSTNPRGIEVFVDASNANGRLCVNDYRTPTVQRISLIPDNPATVSPPGGTLKTPTGPLTLDTLGGSSLLLKTGAITAIEADGSSVHVVNNVLQLAAANGLVLPVAHSDEAGATWFDTPNIKYTIDDGSTVYTIEITAHKNAANGYPGLGAAGAITENFFPRAEADGDLVVSGLKDDGSKVVSTRTSVLVGQDDASSGSALTAGTVRGADNSSTGQGGALALRGGNNGTGTNAGGAASLAGGTGGASSGNAAGGAVSVTGGSGGGSGTGGLTEVRGGAGGGSAGAGGDLNVFGGGGGTGGVGGASVFAGGPGKAAASGAATFRGGDGTSTNSAGGAATARGGDATGNAAGGNFTTRAGSTSSGTNGVWDLQTTAGATRLRVNTDGTLVVNEDGADTDTRIEGDNDANLIYTDAGNDRVGIGTASPSEKLDVNGHARANGLLLKVTALTASDAGSATPDASISEVYIAAGSLSGGANYTVNIPSAVTYSGRLYLVKITAVGGAASTVTLDAAAGNVEGAATLVLDAAARSGVALASDGTDWWRVAS